MAVRSQGSCLCSKRRPLVSISPQRALLLCRSIPTIIFIVVLRLVVGFSLSLLTHLKLLTRLPDNHVLLKRQLTLNVLQATELLLTQRFSPPLMPPIAPHPGADDAARRPLPRTKRGCTRSKPPPHREIALLR